MGQCCLGCLKQPTQQRSTPTLPTRPHPPSLPCPQNTYCVHADTINTDININTDDRYASLVSWSNGDGDSIDTDDDDYAFAMEVLRGVESARSTTSL